MAVTPRIADATEITVAGVAVTSLPANIQGAVIQNPYSAQDQAIVDAEPIYIDPTGGTPGSTPGSGNGPVFTIYPGQTWSGIPGQTTTTRVNAASAGHKFSGVYW